MATAERIAGLYIRLDAFAPAIRRRADVRFTMHLTGRRGVVQAVMLCRDYRLFEFRADGRRSAVPVAHRRRPEWVAKAVA